MGTRAVLGVRNPDGTILGCYVHFDGDTMLPRIESFLSEKTTTCLSLLIAEAQAHGGMSSFHAKLFDYPGPRDDTPSTTTFINDNTPYVIKEDDFFQDHGGTHSWYLVDWKTGHIDVTQGGC